MPVNHKADIHNACLIVKAVNRDHVFDELVEACQSVLIAINNTSSPLNSMESIMWLNTIGLCEQALSKASKLTEEKRDGNGA